MFKYKTVLRCPVCRQIMDEIEHLEPRMSDFGGALLGSGSRRVHAEESPQCVDKPGWHKGWDEDEPVKLMTPEELAGLALEFDGGPYVTHNGRFVEKYLGVDYHYKICLKVRTVGDKLKRFWAVKNGTRECLNKNGVWEFEPRPSERSDEFIERTRFDCLDQAFAALESWKQAEKVRHAQEKDSQ